MIMMTKITINNMIFISICIMITNIDLLEWENAGSATVAHSFTGKACFEALETVSASSRYIRSPSTSLELSLCTFETTATLVEGILATFTACWRLRTLEVLYKETNAGGGNMKVE